MKKLMMFVFLLALSLLALAGKPKGKPQPAQAPPPPPAPGERLADERGRLALSNQFYLELAVGAREIRICHSGIAVATYKLDSLAIAYPRVFWVARQDAGPWVDDVWFNAHLDPPKDVKRVRIVPGDTSTIPTPDKADVIPPTLEELTPVPPVFVIRCDGDRAIHLHLEGIVPGAVMKVTDPHSRWHDFLAALKFRQRDALRLTATIPSAEGAALFRSFPDGKLDLLVLP